MFLKWLVLTLSKCFLAVTLMSCLTMKIKLNHKLYHCWTCQKLHLWQKNEKSSQTLLWVWSRVERQKVCICSKICYSIWPCEGASWQPLANCDHAMEDALFCLACRKIALIQPSSAAVQQQRGYFRCSKVFLENNKNSL